MSSVSSMRSYSESCDETAEIAAADLLLHGYGEIRAADLTVPEGEGIAAFQEPLLHGVDDVADLPLVIVGPVTVVGAV